MGTIQTTQAGGVGTFTGSGSIVLGATCELSYVGVTTSYTWTLRGVPSGSAAVLAQAGAKTRLAADVAGQYVVRFTDNAAVTTDVTIAAAAAFRQGSQYVFAVDPQGGLAFETDTLCTPDISFPEWRSGVVGGLTVSALAGQATIDSLLDAVWLNAQQDVSGDVPKSWVFTVPDGSTSLRWTVPMIMPAATGTKAIGLKVYNSSAVLVSSKTVTVTSVSVNTDTFVITGLQPGSSYILGIHCNDASQNANPYVGRVSLVPVGASGVFATSFRRLRVASSMVAGNIQSGWNNGLYPFISPNADILFNTNASQIAVESYGSSAVGTISALYSGQPIYNGVAIANGVHGYDAIPLPYAGEPANVTIRTGTGLGTLGNVLGKYTGVFVRAIFVPTGSSVDYVPFNTRDLCIGVGDSLILGNSSGDLPFQSWSARFRQQYSGSFAIDAHNSRRLFDYGATAAQQDAFARYLGKVSPKIIIWDLSVNDYKFFPWPGGAGGYLNFAVALANIIDLVRDRYSPLTKHVIKTATRLTNEAVDLGNGTLPNFRTGMTAIATGRATYVTVVDGTSLMAVGDIDIDGIHMTTVGQAKVGSGMIAALAALVPPEV